MTSSSRVIRLLSFGKLAGSIDEELMEVKRLIMPLVHTNSLDIHPAEPWILASTSPGQVSICDVAERPFKTFDLKLSTGLETKVEKEQVRCGKFVPNKQWIIVGTDSSRIYCYDYSTMCQVYAKDTDSGPIRTLSVHPTLSICLSYSEEEKVIRAWSWKQTTWKQKGFFAGHTASVEHIMWHPENPNIFVSASLDNTVKIWSLSSPAPIHTLFGHKSGVSFLDYYTKEKKLFIVSGDNDKCVKTWDFGSRKCVKTQESYGSSVASVKTLSTCVAKLVDRVNFVALVLRDRNVDEEKNGYWVKSRRSTPENTNCKWFGTILYFSVMFVHVALCTYIIWFFED